MISKLRGPVYVQVELTSDCNNKCLHCYNFWRNTTNAPKRKVMSEDDLKKLAQVLGQIGVFYVTITGGEPFLRRKELFHFLNSLQEQNIRPMINSNATLITDEGAKQLSHYPIEIFLASLISWDPKQHDRVAISTNAHQRTVAGIRHLLKYGIPVAVNMVASKLNYQELFATGQWVHKEFGIKDFSATPICPSLPEHRSLELDRSEISSTVSQLLRLRQELDMRVDILEVLPMCLFEDDDVELTEMFSGRICTAGNTTITVGSEGDVRVCSYDKQVYGNILLDNFSVIWDRMSRWRNDSLMPQECKVCEILETCGGGCRVNAQIHTGDYCELDTRARGAIVKQRAKPLLKDKGVPPDLKLRATKNISFREESLGVFLVVANPTQFVLTNKDGLALIRHLLSLPDFTPRLVADSFNLNLSSIEPFLRELHQKRFILPI